HLRGAEAGPYVAPAPRRRRGGRGVPRSPHERRRAPKLERRARAARVVGPAPGGGGRRTRSPRRIGRRRRRSRRRERRQERRGAARRPLRGGAGRGRQAPARAHARGRAVTRVLAVFLFAQAALAAAQPPPGDQRMGPGRARDEGMRMIEAYVLSNLQESLGLTDEQYVKALPLVKKLQTDRREVAHGRMRLLGQMRRTLEEGGATEGQVTELLTQVKALELEGPARIKKSLDAVDAVLTPLQQAKLRVFEVEVERKLRELLSEIRKQRGPG